MLEIIAAFIYIFCTSYCVGHAFIHLIYPTTNSKVLLSHLVLSSLAGLVVITIIAGFLSIFFKTGLWINIFLSIFSIGYLIKNPLRIFRQDQFALKFKSGNILLYCFITVILAMILVKTSGPINNPDSGAYHLPLIKWIEYYKAIKGTANVHSRFGFNYQYLILCAVYGFSFLGIQTVHALNGYLMLLFVIYIFSTLDYYKTAILSRLDTAKLIILFLVLNMAAAVTSFSPDFPTTIMNIMVVLLTLQRIEDKTVYDFDLNALLILTISTGALLFKISALPIFLFNLFFLLPLLKRKKIALLATICASITFAFIPYLIRNYIISGYLIYPLYSVDIFNVPWKLPFHKAYFEKEVIKYFALGIDFERLGIEYGKHASLGELLRSWMHFLKTSNTVSWYVVMVLFASMLLHILFTIYCFLTKKNKAGISYLWLYLLLYISIVYWWLNAPDIRFGNGYILPFIGITIALIFFNLFKKIQLLFINGIYIMLIILSIKMMQGKSLAYVSNNLNKTSYNFISQEKYPAPQYDVLYNERRQIRYIGKDYRENACWEIAQPCSYAADSFEYRGNTIEDGFISK